MFRRLSVVVNLDCTTDRGTDTHAISACEIEETFHLVTFRLNARVVMKRDSYLMIRVR